MKIGIVSDTHGQADKLLKLVQEHPEIDYWLHAGDGASDCEVVRQKTKAEIFTVAGNCDGFQVAKTEEWLSFDIVLIWLVHGHRENVKLGLRELEWTARQAGAKAVVFGHTHTSLAEERDGLWLLNPGSLAECSDSCLVLEILDGAILDVKRAITT